MLPQSVDTGLESWHTEAMKKQLVTATGFVLGVIALTGAVKVGADIGTSFECEDVTVIAEQGDTLWGIASDHCTGHIGHAVYVIGELNEVDTLQVGQEITLP